LEILQELYPAAVAHEQTCPALGDKKSLNDISDPTTSA
jgi:hypothetical protein